MIYNQTYLSLLTKELKKIEQIPSAKQLELIKEYKISPSKKLKDILVNNNLRLALKIIFKRPCEYNTIEDRVSIATISIINALEDFDPSLGFTFATFCRKYIDNDLSIDYHKFGNLIKRNKVLAEKISNGEIPTYTTVSASTMIFDNDGSTIGDILESDTFPNQFDIDNNINHQDKLEEFWKDIKTVLNQKQYDIIRGFYSDGIMVHGKSKRLKDIEMADMFGVTKQALGQSRKFALKKIAKSGILNKYKDNINYFRF
jgi:RNA polymerase sigma factor (sigma-70 family)